MGLAAKILGGLGLVLWMGSVASADEGSVLDGIKLVVDVDGAPNLGTESMGAELRRNMANAVGPLVPSRLYDEAKADQKKKAKKAADAKALSQAGRRVGAQYVLRLKVQKNKKQVEARLRLIDAESGVVELDERVPSKNPAEARTLGAALAQKAVERLDQLVRARRTLAEIDKPIDPPTRTEAHAPPPPPPPPVVDASPPPPPPPLTAADEERARFVAAKEAARRAQLEGAAKPVSEAPAAAPTPAPPPSTELELPKPERRTPGILRVAVGGGAGLMRSYQLSSDQVGRSSLSHALDPLGLITVEGELLIPKLSAGVLVRGAFRPLHYAIDTNGPNSSDPAGSLFDASGALTYHLLLRGEGAGALRLIPQLGFRGSFSLVEEHPGDIIPSATTLAVFTGATLRWPVNEVLELAAGLQGGLIVAYQETPQDTGTSASGFNLGGELSARIWVTNHVAIAFDNHLTFDSVAFSGAPTRAVPPDEVGRLADVQVRIWDLRSSVGAAFRF
jgi:hypothetical protein